METSVNCIFRFISLSELRTKYSILERLTTPALIVIAGAVPLPKKETNNDSTRTITGILAIKAMVHKSPLEIALLNYH